MQGMIDSEVPGRGKIISKILRRFHSVSWISVGNSASACLNCAADIVPFVHFVLKLTMEDMTL